MREMRRTDRLITEEKAWEILKNGEYGVLATVDDAGQPYGVPLSYVVKDGHIYYHATSEGGSKQDNITNNGKVSLTVVGKTQVLPEKFGTLYESAIAYGVASVVDDEEERLAAFREFLNKYSAEFLEEGEKYIKAAGPKAIVVRIAISTVSGKSRG